MLNILFFSLVMAAACPLFMRILGASVSVSNRAATIIRDIMSKGDLGIVEKVP